MTSPDVVERLTEDALETARQRAIVLFQAYARGVTDRYSRSEAQLIHDVETFSSELADALKHPISRNEALASLRTNKGGGE